ncbi:MAG TPA: UBP-type zinc finger domain-containing protein [Blastocatellia bacterium]|nr:UBP-type zinc finger domain-containing protein [Blastocatellia bacterium]
MPSISASECPHIKVTDSNSLSVANITCAECDLSAPTRVCITCGHIGCCESTNGHALAHSLASGHPLIRELPISQRSFTWCYGCNSYIAD